MAAPRVGAKSWSGRRVTEARAFMNKTTNWPTRCGQCKKPVKQSDAWAVGHIKARATHPELTWDPSN